MGKAIFTSSGDEYFKLKRSGANPTIVARIPKKANMVRENSQEKIVSATLNTLIDGDTGDATNAELYDQLVDAFTASGVTNVHSLLNEFTILLDYTIYNQKGVKIKRDTVTREIDAKDVAVIMGVDASNNTTYRHGKQMNVTFKLKVENQSPFGVMAPKRRNCTLVVNEIAVFQALDIPEKRHKYVSSYDLHRMNDGRPYNKRFTKDLVRIYSSIESGVEFDEISLPYLPVTVALAVNVLDINFTVVYDDAEIAEIITQNREAAADDGSDDDSGTTDSGTTDDGSTDDGSEDDGSEDGGDSDDDSETDGSETDSTFNYEETE